MSTESRTGYRGDLALEPIRKASQFTLGSLYWLPVQEFPMRLADKTFFVAFLDQLSDRIVKKYKLPVEAFLQIKVLKPENNREFHKRQMELSPVMGLSRSPGAAFPKIPSEEDLGPIMRGEKKFVFDDHVADYCYWFLSKNGAEQRKLFLGFGGMTFVSLSPELSPAVPDLPFNDAHKSHPMFQKFDIAGIVANAFAMSSEFAPLSKKLFGKGLEEDPQYDGAFFIIPLLRAKDFFSNPPEEVSTWLNFFEFYITESPEDRGVLIASKHNLDEDLKQILNELRSRGLVLGQQPN